MVEFEGDKRRLMAEVATLDDLTDNIRNLFNLSLHSNQLKIEYYDEEFEEFANMHSLNSIPSNKLKIRASQGIFP
jgi:division protein CdvB (Snf7/Vps24/ESCRT-III family)